MELFPLFILLVESILITTIDRILFKTFITPSIILLIPYLIIISIIILWGKSLGLVPLYYESIYVWIIGIIPFWLAGILAVIIFRPNRINNCGENIKQRKWIIILFISVATIIFIKLLYLFKSKYVFGSKDFGEEYIGRGIWGHISNLLFLIFPYFAIIFKKSFRNYMTLLVLMFLVLAYGSKTWFLSLIFATFLLTIHYKKIKISPLTLILPILVGFSFFSIYYSLSIKYNFFSFVTRHFIDYLTSGILPLSEYVKHNLTTGIDTQYVLSPFINSINAINGNQLISAHSQIWILTDTKSNFQSNVYTFFGTLYIYSGISLGIMLAFSLGLLNYVLLIVSRVLNSIFINIAYYTSITILLWGWFNFGYILLRPWEIITFSITFHYLSKLYLRNKQFAT